MKNRLIATLLSLAMLCGAVGGTVLSATAAQTLGDVDGNSKINTTDARLTLQYAARRIGTTALNLSAADVDDNGKVNTTDARLILQYAAKRITDFRTAASQKFTYSQFPGVPDFGGTYGVVEDYRSYEEGFLYVSYDYTDIFREDTEGEIMVSYLNLLLNEYGFSMDDKTEEDGETTYWLLSSDQRLTVALSLDEDAYVVAVFDNEVYNDDETGDPTYAEFPEMPDFGALYGVAEYDRTYEDGHLFVAYEYTDILRVDEEGEIVSEYLSLLFDEYEFFTYQSEEGDGYSIYMLVNSDMTLGVIVGFSENLFVLDIYTGPA